MANRDDFSIANRKEPIPVIQVTSHGGERTPSPSGRRAHFRSHSQGRLDNITSRIGDKVFEKLESKKSEGPNTIQDRLLNLYVNDF